MKALFNGVRVFLVLALTGCGGGGGGSDSPARVQAAGSANSNSGINGIWEVYWTFSSGADERYLVIKGDGETVTGYDYLGDSFNNGPNCYKVESLALERISGDNYRWVENPNTPQSRFVLVTVTVSDTDLNIVTDGGVTLEGVQTTLLESDFDPVCS